MTKFFKDNKKSIIMLIIGIIIGSITGVTAYIVTADNITYNNSQSGLNSTTLQGAIDELYNKVGTNYCKSGFEKVNDNNLGYQCLDTSLVSCPGTNCKYAVSPGTAYWYTAWNTANQTPTVLTSSNYTTQMNDGTHFAMILNDSSQIFKAYYCIKTSSITNPVCLEVKNDNSKYSENLEKLNTLDNTCSCNSSTNSTNQLTSYTCNCEISTGSFGTLGINSDGTITYGSNTCLRTTSLDGAIRFGGACPADIK